ncbi:MAG: four helix bundle protein [Chrysiogenia bacterium]
MNWRDLQVWKKAHILTIQIYKITKEFPREERYGLASQIQRAAYSVPLNIVEGDSRKSAKEFLQFLNIARGSLEELRYLLILSCEIDYISNSDRENLEWLAAEICIMLDALIKSLQKRK